MENSREGRGFPGERGERGTPGTRGGGAGGQGGTGGEGGQAEVSPRFNRALIAVGVIVLAVVTTLLLLIQEQIQTTRVRLQQDAQLAERIDERQQQLILEIRAQSRLNACLTLKLAKRHDVDIGGLDSPACKVFPNGGVIFPGAEPGSSLNPGGPGPLPPGARRQPKPAPKNSPQPVPKPPENQPSPPGPGQSPPPQPSPSPSGICFPFVGCIT